MKGVYCLLIENNADKRFKAGVKRFFLKKGYYCYVGSAMNNLDKRIERHKNKKKNMHWHIDYFLKHAEIIDVKKHETDLRKECFVSRIMDLISSERIDSFGCSDCKCRSHLYYFDKNPLRKINDVFRNL
ncbi:MAG: GIY-YIG nuclease family protein [Candidatus Nanoarchaeia archaeon]|nr:GIY-YIG nuclease family protein [Candidatus Nanoarchaeia archaeon]